MLKLISGWRVKEKVYSKKTITPGRERDKNLRKSTHKTECLAFASFLVLSPIEFNRKEGPALS